MSNKNQFFSFIKQSITLHIIFALMAVGIAYGTFTIMRQVISLSRESKLLEKKIDALRREKSDLEVLIRELETPWAVQREAKDHLNLKMSGEEVVIVVPEKKEILPKAPTSFWERIKRVFQ